MEPQPRGAQIFPRPGSQGRVEEERDAEIRGDIPAEIDFVELQMNELNRETGERHPVNHIDMNLRLRLADEDGNIRWVRPHMNPEIPCYR